MDEHNDGHNDGHDGAHSSDARRATPQDVGLRAETDRLANSALSGGSTDGEAGRKPGANDDGNSDDERRLLLDDLIMSGLESGSGKTANEHQILINQRRLARRIAIQALFEIDSAGHAPGVVIDERLASHAPGPHAAQHLRWLVTGVVANWDALNGWIHQYAPDFPVEQLAIVDRNILRLAIFEIGSKESDAPAKAVINEAVELGKLFGSDSSPRFINGVLGSALDSVYRKLF